jgi:alkylhydroperoxidase family enzyme
LLGQRDDGRKLQEITDQHHLNAAERFRPVACKTQAAINDIEQVASHHRHLVDDETVDLAKATRRNKYFM